MVQLDGVLFIYCMIDARLIVRLHVPGFRADFQFEKKKI